MLDFVTFSPFYPVKSTFVYKENVKNDVSVYI